MTRPDQFEVYFAAKMDLISTETVVKRTMGKRLEVRMSRLMFMGYRRLVRREGRPDRWQKDGWDFLGVPIVLDLSIGRFGVRLHEYKAWEKASA